jgi:hypothetical protein
MPSKPRTNRLIRVGAIVREIEVEAQVVCEASLVGPANTDCRAHPRAIGIPLRLDVGSTRVLLLSHSSRSTSGLGAASGVLGRRLVDHVKSKPSAMGRRRRPGPARVGRCLYLPRFDARELGAPRSGRGFGVQQPRPAGRGRSYFSANSFAEMLPREENRVTLDPDGETPGASRRCTSTALMAR